MAGCVALRKTTGLPKKFLMAPYRASLRPGVPDVSREVSRAPRRPMYGTLVSRVVNSPRFPPMRGVQPDHDEPVFSRIRQVYKEKP
jgi:hypothetical protein